MRLFGASELWNKMTRPGNMTDRYDTRIRYVHTSRTREEEEAVVGARGSEGG